MQNIPSIPGFCGFFSLWLPLKELQKYRKYCLLTFSKNLKKAVDLA
jgi:hypothetical protein